MQSGKTIVGIAIIIILLATGYAFLVGEDTQNNTAVDSASPERLPQSEQFHSKIPSKDEKTPVPREKESAAIAVPAQEEIIFDESSLPTGLPPEDAILDPDAEEVIDGADATPVNIGEYLDPDSEYPLSPVSDAEEEVVNIGEFLDPDADPLTKPSDAEETPQHIGPFIDVDGGESGGAGQSVSEEVVNIGEHIDPE